MSCPRCALSGHPHFSPAHCIQALKDQLEAALREIAQWREKGTPP